ncbi:heterokaryon incompatibility protein-domain-containing protein, partial [Hyaloscypha finlandica]
MDAANQIFPYAPLNTSKAQIRLIYLQPRLLVADEITCELCIADLDDTNLFYEALSYEWGSPWDLALSIELDGQSVPVRKNLWWALWHLSGDGVGRLLWVDALCIDQGNDRERNHQVGQMGRVYSSATRVVAWIGREDPLKEAEKAINFVKLLYGTSEETRYCNIQFEWVSGYSTKDGRHLIETTNVANRNKLAEDEKEVVKAGNHPGWKSLIHFCRRPYSSRLWIIQELVLARNIIIQCGKFNVSWDAVEHVFGQVPSTTPWDQYNDDAHLHGDRHFWTFVLWGSVPYKIFMQRQDCVKGLQSHALLENYCLYREAGCADTRDKLFGLIGLSSRCCQDAVKVDY